MPHQPEETGDLTAKEGGQQAQPDTDKRAGERRKDVVSRRTVDTGLERRRGPGRRRSDFARSAEEGEMQTEQFSFIAAIDAYKRVNQKPFPTWTEVLEVIRKLGYRKTCASVLTLENIKDWTESPDSPAFIEDAQDADAQDE